MGLFGKKEKASASCCCNDVDSLIVKEDQDTKQEESGSRCGCTEGCCNSEQGVGETVIKVLGSGCKNCITLAENVEKAVEELKLAARIEKVTDFAEITRYGVMSTPALVINEKVVAYGKVLKPQEIIRFLEKVVG